MKVNDNIDVRLKTNLKNIQTLIFTKRSFSYVILSFTQSHLGPLGNIDGYIQSIPGTYKCDRPINITAIEKVHLKCDCINGSIVDGVREPLF